jgi:flagellar hook-associated protein 1 FlgK
MANFTSKILGNSVSAMTTTQALLANSSNNIANVNTPGYTRREISIETRADPASVDGVLRIGSGVQLGQIRRITNEFLEKSLRSALSTQGQATVKNEYLGRVESLFSLSSDQMTVGYAFNNFFSAVNQLGIDPSNLDLRFDVLERGTDLVSSIKGAFSEIADAQSELNYRVSQEVSQINAYTRDIASLNSQVAQREAAGVSAIDERDQRDVLLAKLAEKISFTTNELPSGAINCFLSNGLPLVNEGSSRSLGTTTEPSFATGPLPPSLRGEVLSYVVYNFGTEAAPSHIDLTNIIKNGGGALAGTLQVRGYADVSNTSAYEADGELVQMASRLEAMTRMLLTEVNKTYRGPNEDPTAPTLQPSSADLNGNSPDVFGLFDFDFSGVKDADGDGIATIADLTASGIDSFSRILKLGFSKPEEFAAARDVDPLPGSTAFNGGNGENAAALAVLRNENFNFNLGPLSFTGTFDELYNSAVSTIGSLKFSAQSSLQVAQDSYVVTAAKRDEFSSVSLDEEFANVIKFQKAFQASARMIRTASDMIDTIVGLI